MNLRFNMRLITLGLVARVTLVILTITIFFLMSQDLVHQRHIGKFLEEVLNDDFLEVF